MAVLRLPATFAAPAKSVLSSDLQNVLAQTAAHEKVRVILYLHGEASLTTAALPAAELPRRAHIVALLQETAVSAQAPLQNELQTLQKAGAVNNVRPLWIINALATTANPNAIKQLAANPAVARVVLDEQHAYFDPPESAFDPDALFATTAVFTSPIRSWGIDRIQAPHVWHGLDVDGTGVTVAIMDTGVLWQHPDLLPNYRGNQGGTVDHAGNWYFTPVPTMTTPIDLHGHGTHVMGTAVGQNGIGVAPGATWIAVGVSDESGLIFDSDLHAGFQWLLAPDGDPAKAPDIVNNSWGASGTRTVFYEDIETLQAAGIITVFSTGNSGPAPGTIGVPAAYTNTIAIGAIDELDQMAWFSSRGPSSLTAEQHPHLVAPGTAIYSSYLDNGYGYLNGTSMAAPHVVGTMALLLSANPALNRSQLLNQMQQTAVPIDPPHPNDDSGWGLVDAYAAVSEQVTTGILEGVVRFNGTPQAGVVVTVTNSSGHGIPFVTNASGRYTAVLRPGNYAVSTAPFGFAPITFSGQTITANGTTKRGFNLTRLPFGTMTGTVRDAQTGEPLNGVAISAKGLPITAVTNANGRYEIELPVAQVKLIAGKTGYQLDRATVLPQAGQTQTADFALTPGRRILLVDGDQWVYQSRIAAYQDSLTALNYSFDTWSIRNPFTDIPTHLPDYDTVIWAHPSFSPGYIGAGAVVSDYLKLGGDMLISGQNVAAYDGGIFDSQRWWTDYVGGNFLGKTAVMQTITTHPDAAFANMALTLNGGSSANNQVEVDMSRPLPNAVSEPILQYEDGIAAGLTSGRCQKYDIVYLGFGLEGVTDSTDRAMLIQSSFDTFDAPETVTGVRWRSDPVDAFAVAGSQLVYTVTLRNLSELYTDTFRIDLTQHGWPTTVISPTVQLGPCEIGKTAVSIQVPANAGVDKVNLTEVTAVSTIDSNTQNSLTFRHKTPGHILLVDDHRWYDQTAKYQAHLDKLGLTYDTWRTEDLNALTVKSVSDFLQAFDLIIWYTAYDWFAPITPSERAALQAFLAQDGRLFLTSQDFLFYNHPSALTEELGVFAYQEGITPTVLYGGDLPHISHNLHGPFPLSYTPYRNFSDGIIPVPEADVFLWSDAGLPAAVGRSADSFRAVLMSVPLETMDASAQTAAMNQLVGWIGDLGDSTVRVDSTQAAAGSTHTFTITVRNDSPGYANQITMRNPLPAALQIDAGSIQGDATYNASTRTLVWTGNLADGAAHQIIYQAAIAPGTPDGIIENPVQFTYKRHRLTYEQVAKLWVGTPDLRESTLTAVTNTPFGATAVTYTLHINNSGIAATNGITAAISFPAPLHVVSGSVRAAGGAPTLLDQTLTWVGDIDAADSSTVTVMLTRTAGTRLMWYPTALVLQEGTTDTTVIEHRLGLRPYEWFFPIVVKEIEEAGIED